MPFFIPAVTMVGDADEIAEFELVDPGLFLYFAESGHFDGFSRILMPFRKVPKAVSADEEIIPATV